MAQMQLNRLSKVQQSLFVVPFLSYFFPLLLMFDFLLKIAQDYAHANFMLGTKTVVILAKLDLAFVEQFFAQPS